MIRPRVEFRRYPEISAEEAAPEFGNQFFARPFAAILELVPVV